MVNIRQVQLDCWFGSVTINNWLNENKNECQKSLKIEVKQVHSIEHYLVSFECSNNSDTPFYSHPNQLWINCMHDCILILFSTFTLYFNNHFSKLLVSMIIAALQLVDFQTNICVYPSLFVLLLRALAAAAFFIVDFTHLMQSIGTMV